MIEWKEYIDLLIDCESCFDGISISLGNDFAETDIPPLVKASILMLDKMVSNQGKYNILVFPEKVQLIFVFVIMMLLHNINKGRIKRAYDPASFQQGEKLKLGNAVVEFLGIEQRSGKQCVKIRMADLQSYSAPLDFLPFFQRTNTQRRLSTLAKFIAAKKRIEKKHKGLKSDEKKLLRLADYKTHMDSSLFYMTSLIKIKEMIDNFKLCEKKISDILLIGQTNYNGEIHSLGAGQMAGIPAIVLASDLYSIVAAIENQHPVEFIIIDASNMNLLLGQLDEIDKLIRLGVPIVCVTDIMNSFDLQPLKDRNFNIWRWDKTSITDRLYNVTPLSSDKKTRNCARHEVNYLYFNDKEVSDATRLIMSLRNEAKEQSPKTKIRQIFSKLYGLTFSALREVVPLNERDIIMAHQTLTECKNNLAYECPFLSRDTYESYNKIIDNLYKIYDPEYKLSKQTALEKLLTDHKHHNICIIIPERSDKNRVKEYWQRWCEDNCESTILNVLYPAEYYSVSCSMFSLTIVIGWLKRAIMRKIIYSFNTQKYTILLYDYESRWKNYDIRKWSEALDNYNNKKIITHSFCTNGISISTRQYTLNKISQFDNEVGTVDELNEIELIFREGKYKQFAENGREKSVQETTEAIPVNYIGGYLAFYRKGHKVLSATNIILHGTDKIESVYPEQLKVGDFVVVRETDRDLIKEMADILLEKRGKSGFREMATKWKEALKTEQQFSTPEQIYQKLTNAGCTKGFQTVQSWLTDEDIIAPQMKQDLKYIADITGNEMIAGLLDQIYEAAQIVRSAHIKAGKILTALLKKKIVGVLSNYGDIDPFNIWEPMEMFIDNVGLVRILKIIDIGSPIFVDVADTNRLIEE
jgi:hypothetical protein